MSPAQIRAAAERWCSNYHPRPYDDGSVFYSSLPVPPEVMQTGILYRPNVAHKVVIMRKFDPYGPERWQPFQTVMVGMPNLGPILSIGVERALFATRDTDLVFNQGVLTDVSIDKKSELVGFVRIPLAVAKAVVGVPAQILQIRIADTRNQTALLNAQGELANTLSKIRQDNAKGAGDALGTRSAVSREGQFVGSCMNAGGDPESCQRLARPTQ
jgi:hypothetical protein